MSEVWDLITIGWDRIDHKEPGLSSDDVNAFERSRGVVLPDAVRWLDQQSFVLARTFGYLHADCQHGERVEELLAHAPAVSTRVSAPVRQWWGIGEPPPGADDGELHYFSEAVYSGQLPAVYKEWLPKLVVVWSDDFNNAYMLDFHFDAVCPPVVYANWSEGSRLLRTSNLAYVADSYEDFLLLPAATGDGGFEFVPDRGRRALKWESWMTERTVNAVTPDTKKRFLR